MGRERQAHPVDQQFVAAMLAAPRIAVVGASDDPKSFGRTIYLAVRDRAVEAVAVHPTAEAVAGDPCYPTLADVPEAVDVAIVMVPAPASVDVVRQCAALGITKVWLFRGLGGVGAASPQAIEAATELGLDVVPGACPLMFLEPAGWIHRIHRAARRRNGSLATVT